MRKSFDNLKKESLIKSLIISAAFGLCVGLFVFGVVLLTLKLTAVLLSPIAYVFILVGVAIVSGGICFLIIRPTDARLAKKLDNEYALGERAQTLIEFEGSSSDVAVLQRKDASERLKNLPKKPIKMGQAVTYAVAPLVALAMLVTGIIVPQKYPPVPVAPEDLPFKITDTQLERLEEVIENVGKSDLDEDLRATFSYELVELLGILTEDDVTQGEMYSSVQSAMKSVSTATVRSTSFDDFCQVLTEESRPEAVTTLGNAVLDAVYKYRLSAEKRIEYTAVVTKSGKLAEEIASALDAVTESLIELVDATTEDDYADFVKGYADAISYATKKVVGLAELKSDELYIAFDRFGDYTDKLYDYWTDTTDYTLTAVQQFFVDYLKSFNPEVARCLNYQAYTWLIDEYVRYSLGDIFNVKVIAMVGGSAVEDDGSVGGNENSGAGGGGSGDNKYGSDDEIYDPATGTYKPYYELLNGDGSGSGYAARLEDLLLRGDVSPEVQKYIREYLQKLYSVSEE